jgi:excisionase family DNA binding protein
VEILASLRKTAYTVNEVVETASVGRTTLYAYANAGSLRLTKVGTKTIVLATDLAAWLASLRNGTT